MRSISLARQSAAAPPPDAEIDGAYRDLQRAIMHADRKLIRYPAVNVVRLFDLRSDPEEAHDLANDPAWHRVRQDLEDVSAGCKRRCAIRSGSDR